MGLGFWGVVIFWFVCVRGLLFCLKLVQSGGGVIMGGVGGVGFLGVIFISEVGRILEAIVPVLWME